MEHQCNYGVRQSATRPLRAGVSYSKSKGNGVAHRPLIRGAELGRPGDYSAPSGAAVPVSGPGAGVGVMPGAATKSLRLTAASPSRSAPLSHGTHAHMGSQRVPWQALVQGNASMVNAVQARGTLCASDSR